MLNYIRKLKTKKLISSWVKNNIIKPYYLNISTDLFGVDISGDSPFVIYDTILDFEKFKEILNKEKKFLKVKNLENTSAIIQKDKIIIFLKNENESINELSKYISIKYGNDPVLISKYDSIQKELRYYVKSKNIKKILSHLSNEYNIAIYDTSICIFKQITPNLIWEDGIFYNIPKQHQKTIYTIHIELDMYGRIISVLIPPSHPNTDKNGYYCFGSGMKLRQLNKGTLDLLISYIMIYNLDASYWVPEWYNEQFKKENVYVP